MNDETRIGLMLRLARKLTALAERFDPDDEELKDIRQSVNEIEESIEEAQRLGMDDTEKPDEEEP